MVSACRIGLVVVFATLFFVPSRASGQSPRRHHRRHPSSTPNGLAPDPFANSASGTPPPPVVVPPSPSDNALWEPAPPTTLPAPPPPLPADRFAALDISGGLRAFNRSMSWSTNGPVSFHDYALNVATSVTAAVEWYPGAHSSSGVASWFGLVANIDHDLGLVSVDARQQQYPTTAWGCMAGLRVRYPFKTSDLGVTLGYGLQTFSIANSAAGPDPGEPGVAYQYFDVSLGGRIGVSPRFAILASAAWLPVLSGGPLTSTYFPHASIQGIDLSAGLAVTLVDGFELRALFDARWFLTSTGASMSDTWYATSASDQYLSGALALAWRR